jgi:hypothetical protein
MAQQADMNHTGEEMVTVLVAQEGELHIPLGLQELRHKKVEGTAAVDMPEDHNRVSSEQQAGNEDKSSGIEDSAADMLAHSVADMKVHYGLEMKEAAEVVVEEEAHIL